MARTRTLSQMREESYRRADCEGAYDRHDRADVDRDLNQGSAEMWDALIEARGAEYLQTSATLTTTADTSSYALTSAAPTFYILIGVRVDETGGYPLTKFAPHEEAALRDPNAGGGWPTHYQLRRTGAGVSSLVILPEHEAGLTIAVDYVPAFTDMVDDTDTFDGLNGWEDYPIDFAARKMAMRDEDWDLADRLEKDMARTKARIMRVSPKRDLHQARRSRDVRANALRIRRFPPP